MAAFYPVHCPLGKAKAGAVAAQAATVFVTTRLWDELKPPVAAAARNS